MASATPDRNEIIALEREWCSRVKAGDVDWVVDHLAEKSLQFPPGAPLIEGADNLRQAWTELAKTPGLELSWEPTEVQVSAANDMAYVYGAAQMKMPDGQVQAAKYVVVWVKEKGEWKIALDIFNTDQ